MIQMKKYTATTFIKGLYFLLLPATVLFACKKSALEPVDTYPDPPGVLVKFLDGNPNPALGAEGSTVTFNVSGLKGKEGQFTFFINQVAAQVVSVTENTDAVKVPANASTGGSAILINGEYYFGPTFYVKGKVSIDPLFNTDAYTSNGPIAGIFKRADGTSYLIYGAFTNYKNAATAINPITGIALLNTEGDYLPVASQFKLGKFGFNGSITNVIQRTDGKYMVAGAFSKLDTVTNLNNIVRLNADGSLETVVVDVINPDPVNNPNDGLAVVPSFNGGPGGLITKLFYNNSTGYSTAVGNFSYHLSTFYERSTRTGPFLDLVKARQIIRMKDNGAFDSSFNYNFSTNESYAGGNGFIYDALQQSDGKIVVTGNFTSFHGISANYIVRIDGNTGTVDPTFNTGKTGADASINRITYNAVTNKILLTGTFKNYNGAPANGVVMIDNNGATVSSFTFKTPEGGFPNFAAQLNNGKVIVTGSFSKYDNIVRAGMAILNPDGTLAAGYNNIGLFRGQVNNLVETTSTNGSPAVIMVGSFDRFDNRQVGNIVKFRMEN
jgi:hypothetical protein